MNKKGSLITTLIVERTKKVKPKLKNYKNLIPVQKNKRKIKLKEVRKY
jgi:hypothetical protein